jgi:hypothetical protein
VRVLHQRVEEEIERLAGLPLAGQVTAPDHLADAVPPPAAGGAIVYADPHICVRCRSRSTELLWQCPNCHDWNTFVEERIAPAKDSEASLTS